MSLPPPLPSGTANLRLRPLRPATLSTAVATTRRTTSFPTALAATGTRATSGFRTRGLPATALGLTLALSALTRTAAMLSSSEALRAGASSRSFGPVGLGAAAAAGGPTLALAARFTYTSSCIFPVGAVARALPGQASGQLGCCDVADAFLILPLHLHVWHSCSSSCSLFRFSGAAGSDVLQCLMHLLCSASLVRPGLRALSTSSMCVRSPACIASGSRSLTLWPAAMVGSQELPVLRRWCWASTGVGLVSTTRKGCFGSGYWSFYVPGRGFVSFLSPSWGCVSTLSGLRFGSFCLSP